MSLASLIARAQQELTLDLVALCGASGVAAGDVYSDDASRLYLHAVAKVLPTRDVDVLAILESDPSVREAPVAGWVFDEFDLADSPIGIAQAQIAHDVWHAVARFHEELLGEPEEHLIVLVAGRRGFRLCDSFLPDTLFHRPRNG